MYKLSLTFQSILEQKDELIGTLRKRIKELIEEIKHLKGI